MFVSARVPNVARHRGSNDFNVLALAAELWPSGLHMIEQFVVIVGSSTTVAARETSFAILDTGHTSASGDAAALVDPAHGKCEVTVHAAG